MLLLVFPFVHTIVNRPYYFFVLPTAYVGHTRLRSLSVVSLALTADSLLFFSIYLFNLQPYIIIQDAYHLLQLRGCRPTGGSFCLPGLSQLQTTRGKGVRPPVRPKFEPRDDQDKCYRHWDKYFSLWVRPHNRNYTF